MLSSLYVNDFCVKEKCFKHDSRQKEDVLPGMGLLKYVCLPVPVEGNDILQGVSVGCNDILQTVSISLSGSNQ